MLAGLAGAGKTQFALAHGKHPLLVRTIEQLKQITEDTDLLVFDDMDFRKWDVNSVKHLLDIEEASGIDCRYLDASIPAGIPRIFCTNSPCQWPFNHIFPQGECQDNYKAITRRHRVVRVAEKLFATE